MFGSFFLLLLQRRLSCAARAGRLRCYFSDARGEPPHVTHDLADSWFAFQQFSRSGNGSGASSRWQNENRPLSDDKQTLPKKNLKHSIKTDDTSCSSCASSQRKRQRQTKQRDGEQLRSFSTRLWHHAEFMELINPGAASITRAQVIRDHDYNSDPVTLWTAAFRTSHNTGK